MLENMHRIQERIDRLKKDCAAMHHHRRHINRNKKSFETELNKAQNGDKSKTNEIAASPASKLPDNSESNDNELEKIIEKHAKANNLNPELVKQLINIASGGNASMVGKDGKLGLMQLQPDLFRSFGYTDPFDPEQNVSAGTKHLADLLNQNGNNLELALAAFNTDKATVNRFGGVPPFKNTKSFINDILQKIRKIK